MMWPVPKQVQASTYFNAEFQPNESKDHLAIPQPTSAGLAIYTVAFPKMP